MAKPDKLIVEDEDGNEVVIPSKFETCDRCNGKGVHDHPAFANGISADDWNGPDWDDESREGYLRGAYDVKCSECDGLRVVLVPDDERMTPEQAALVEWRAARDAAYARERESELRWGY